MIRAFAVLAAAAFASVALAADRVRVGKAVPFAWTFTPIDVGIETGIFAKAPAPITVTGFAWRRPDAAGLVSDSIDVSL